jgi:hypothetical protein
MVLYDLSEPPPLPPFPPILQALVLLLAEEGDDMVLAAWKACEAVAGTIPKENQVRRCLFGGLHGARDGECFACISSWCGQHGRFVRQLRARLLK